VSVQRPGAVAGETLDAARALRETTATLAAVHDVLDARVEEPVAPAWCAARGWSGFLLGLSDAELARCEAEGLPSCPDVLARAPASLRELAAHVRALSALPACVAADGPEVGAPWSGRAVSERKRRQLAALLAALGPMAARASRIVDVGAGRGHFTEQAAARFERAALGIERDPARVAAAAARVAKQRPPGADVRAASASFLAVDAGDDVLSFRADDLAVGLHACGALGDRLVQAAARDGCDVALVSCCLQKRDDDARAPLACETPSLRLARHMLGLTNLSAQPEGVEADLAAMMEQRRVRYALRRLLRARGLDEPHGREMRGINRRRSREGLGPLAARACAERGLPSPTAAELELHERASREEHARIRRFALPRSMLGRLVELAVARDRAAALAEHGAAVRVAALCEREATPRNVALFASRDPARLPPVR
jgi:hypothetical protein